MAESKIILALAQFKSDYAWDKSLCAPAKLSTSENAPVVYSGDYLEDFVRAQQAAAQQDRS